MEHKKDRTQRPAPQRGAAHPGDPAQRDAGKRTERITVHLTETELAELDQERKERVVGSPGASLSRSALLAQVYREHRARQGAGG